MGIEIKSGNEILEDELYLKRSKHLFVQWLISGNRRVLPKELKAFVESRPEEAQALFKHFRDRSRRRIKGKKYLFTN